MIEALKQMPHASFEEHPQEEGWQNYQEVSTHWTRLREDWRPQRQKLCLLLHAQCLAEWSHTGGAHSSFPRVLWRCWMYLTELASLTEDFQLLLRRFNLASFLFQISNSSILSSRLLVSLQSCFTAPTFSMKIWSWKGTQGKGLRSAGNYPHTTPRQKTPLVNGYIPATSSHLRRILKWLEPQNRLAKLPAVM